MAVPQIPRKWTCLTGWLTKRRISGRLSYNFAMREGRKSLVQEKDRRRWTGPAVRGNASYIHASSIDILSVTFLLFKRRRRIPRHRGFGALFLDDLMKGSVDVLRHPRSIAADVKDRAILQPIE